MAKININFNDKEYSIDPAVLSAASTELKSHLSTVMNGTGATINFDGVAYGIDSTKLSAATTEFVTHLGTISGSGSKVVVGGVEYSVDSDKVAGALGELDTILSGLNSGNNGAEGRDPIVWDGNTEGRDVCLEKCFKVSDEAFTKEEVIGAILTIKIHNKLSGIDEVQEILLTSDNVMPAVEGLILTQERISADTTFTLISTSVDGNVGGVEIPSKGTYFVFKEDGSVRYYVSSLTFPA